VQVRRTKIMRNKVNLICSLLLLTSVESKVTKSCGNRSGGIGNVVGGTEINRGKWPWITAFVHVPKNTYFCGGSLISDRRILSGKFSSVSKIFDQFEYF
jgi:secreted trypsin-like serine protease